MKNTFGWRRLDVVGSISSLVFLFSLCFATAIEALQTVFHNGHLDTMHHPDWIMVTVCGNLGLWLLSFVTVGGYSYHQTTAVRQRHGHHLRRDRQTSSRSVLILTTSGTSFLGLSHTVTLQQLSVTSGSV